MLEIHQIEVREVQNIDPKLIDVQKKINEIKENNSWSEITLVFRDGILAYWCEKTTHK